MFSLESKSLVYILRKNFGSSQAASRQRHFCPLGFSSKPREDGSVAELR